MAAALDWVNLLVRWIHLGTGIAWIGSSFYFVWLDSHLTKPEAPRKGVEGEIWMVHSGGFYQVEKRLIGPGEMPKVLHWFKYEALFTLITGLILLTVVYYLTGGAYLIDPAVSSITPQQATLVAAGLLVASWFVYDILWLTLGKTGWLATAISFALLGGVVYGLCHLLSGRAAFIHVGAMMGSIMVVNVWVRILPAQQRMIDATKEGRQPDFEQGKAAKRRSMHNSYMTLPVLFIMLSNHFPATYGNANNWIVLALLIVAGASARYVMIGKPPAKYWAAVPAAVCLVAVMGMTMPRRNGGSGDRTTEKAVTFGEARAIVLKRCLPCHSQYPTDDIFTVAPNGIRFDTPDEIVLRKDRILERAVVQKTMPMANKTNMTDEERAMLGRWLQSGP